MVCPKCGSTNVNVQVVNKVSIREKKGNGCLWWLCIGWWWIPIKWLFFFGIALIVKICKAFMPKKYETVNKQYSLFVCNNCGHNWQANKAATAVNASPVQTVDPETTQVPTAENAATNANKPFYNQWWFWVIIAVVASFIIVGLSPEENETAEATAPAQTVAATIAPTTKAPATIAPKTSAPVAAVAPDSTLRFTLTAGEKGEYGELMTLNKDTEFEETQYVYYIPAGVYIATNRGEYTDQISIYSREIVITSEGWEEPAETFGAHLIQPGKTAEIHIAENQYIEIHEPSILAFEKIG